MNEINSTKQLFQYLKRELADTYDDMELSSSVYTILELSFGIAMADIIIDRPFKLEPEERKEFISIINRLKSNEPLQYVFGRAWFGNHWWNVNEDVLIPRPETEELVNWILESETNENLKLIDIGTGTGCIPVSVKLFREDWEVHACDISPDALQVCAENAKQLDASIRIFNLDILREDFDDTYDIIVSNPPYIPEKERRIMHKRVVGFEPGLALFVPDDNPLVFYETILKKSKKALQQNGKVYFEIHEDLSAEMTDLAYSAGYESELKKDINGKFRMMKCYPISSAE